MSHFIRTVFAWLIIILFAPSLLKAAGPEDHFEQKVRPLLLAKCQKCHGAKVAKAGLRLDSREAILKGGETGPAAIVGEPEKSLMIHAIRHENGLEMPPDGKLTTIQIDDLARWINEGLYWPGEKIKSDETNETSSNLINIAPLLPDSGELSEALQLWLRADSLTLSENDSVYIWPDTSGKGRDFSATKGIRAGGTGLPARFVKSSSIMGRPAIRFDSETGMASSPDNRVKINGDAALTIMIVMNLKPHTNPPGHDTLFSIGNPASPNDPGKPLAALLEIDRSNGNSIDFAGGWGHDVTPGKSSFQSFFNRALILTVIRKPGNLAETTQFFVNGRLIGPQTGRPLEGRNEKPDIQHRSDIGLFMGKALSFCGPIVGDIGEVILYDKNLRPELRLGIEGHLADKYGIWINPEKNLAPPPNFTESEKNHWAYQPLKSLEKLPLSKADESPIDFFISRNLSENSLQKTTEADRLTLIRRVTFDLTGLPPTPEEVDAFISDKSANAYAKVVDRLLNSPRYGEKWARHWLDIVRYAESTANDANAIMRYAWRYRNYVIDAFNEDLPYNQFLIEQIAGDLLPPSGNAATDAKRAIATGYLMIGPKALAETDKEQSRLDIVDDQIDVTGRAMLGLTLACARCHDHKFDAIRTTDYYAMAGIFRSTEPFMDENRNATMWWEFPVPSGNGGESITIMAPKESISRNLRVHLRGNRFTLGRIVPRGIPAIIAQSNSANKEISAAVDPLQPGSGRLELARWISSSKNPLTPRVIANRVWQHHFGRGLVATSDNFGTRGERPSHPDLLDWLARKLIDQGWHLKKLHREILLSQTYRQSSRVSEEARNADPEGMWRSWHPRRRLSAEEIRDAMLAVSGLLDSKPGTSESGEYLNEKAEGIGAKIRPNRVAADDPFYTNFRKRSIYLPVVRNMMPDVLALFDAADPNGVTSVRNETTVASQSLFMLNHPFVREMALAFARRLATESGEDQAKRVNLAHRLAYGREATKSEIADAKVFLNQYIKTAEQENKPPNNREIAAWQSYCQTILCSNEFLYIE